MKKTFEELSGGATLNSEEMFSLKGGYSPQSYGCESSLCETGSITCKSNKEDELAIFCSTAVCKSGAYVIIQPPTICKSSLSGPIVKPVG